MRTSHPQDVSYESRHLRKRLTGGRGLSPQDFFQDFCEIPTVALPGILLSGLRSVGSKSTSKFLVFEKPQNHRSKSLRITRVVQDHSVSFVSNDFRRSVFNRYNHRQATSHRFSWRECEG